MSVTETTETLTTAEPRLITTTEAAELLNVKSQTIRNWIEADSIPYIKLPSSPGGRSEYRIPLHGLLRSLSGNYDLAGELRHLREVARERGIDEETAAAMAGD